MVKNRYNSLVKKWQNTDRKTSLKKSVEKMYQKKNSRRLKFDKKIEDVVK